MSQYKPVIYFHLFGILYSAPKLKFTSKDTMLYTRIELDTRRSIFVDISRRAYNSVFKSGKDYGYGTYNITGYNTF